MPGHCQHGEPSSLFARASRSLSAVFLSRSQDEKRVLVARSSRQRSAIYRRSRTVCSLANAHSAPAIVRSDPIKELGLAGQRPGKGDESADAGPGAAGADVAIGGAIVEGRSRDVDMRPWSAVRHKFPQKGGGQ
jgi:hypothetical protein